MKNECNSNSSQVNIVQTVQGPIKTNMKTFAPAFLVCHNIAKFYGHNLDMISINMNSKIKFIFCIAKIY